MQNSPSRGRIYRTCGCRDEQRKQLGSRCPKRQEDPDHGSWAYAVDLPSTTKPRDTRRRIGFTTRDDALAALERVVDEERTGTHEEPGMRVGEYLLQWLAIREKELRPTTFTNYSENVHKDLLVVFGRIKLCDLRTRHIDTWIHEQLAAGRGRMIVYRVAATLRTALNAAWRAREIPFNPAQYAVNPRPVSPERLCWSPDQAAAFLRHNADTYADLLADLFEVMLATGLRRGEALALHWSDVHLMDRAVYVRWTLAAVNNNQLHLGPPKTKQSRDWVGFNARAIAALQRQAAHQQALQPGTPLEGLVFAHTGGSPLLPQWVLDQLRLRSSEIGLPGISLHDLRHTAATLMISAGVPIAVVSKILRHAKLSTTVDLYGHLLRCTSHEAVDALATVLDLADAAHAERPFNPRRHAA